MIRYMLASYVDDLARNEPINVGVVAYDSSRAVARFDGENPQGQIDLRRVRHRITGSYTYRAWVQYWRRALDDPAAVAAELRDVPPADPRVVAFLAGLPGEEFALRPGGEIILDRDDRELDATLDDLFERLVRPREPESPPTLREKSRRALELAGAPVGDKARFIESFPVELDVKGEIQRETVSYAVRNGVWRYLLETPFNPGSPAVSRKEAHHAAFVLEYAREIKNSGALVLYDATDVVASTQPLIDLLAKFATPVDVSDEASAAPALRAGLELNG
jgi:hypothetical protein